ncbi:MAG TPA: hypothetical protein VGK32_16460 [Vicinamibacterales bacterium]|jgi:hypothetical protein
MNTRHYLLAALLLAVAFLGGSSPHIVGDGAEYVAYGLNFASFRGPSIDPANLPALRLEIAEHEQVPATWGLDTSLVRGRDGRGDFAHFWFYPLLATPGLWVTRACGLHPSYAFAALNLALLGLALAASLRSVGGAGSTLLFLGPILWWIDKPHTEPFTFALLIIAFSLLRDRPWWSLVAAGTAAAQNPPIGALIGLIGVAQILTNHQLWHDRRWWSGVAAGVGLAVLPPLYYLTRYGRLSLLTGATRGTMPAFAEFVAPVLDTDMGLVASCPVFALVALAAVVLLARYRWRDLLAGDVQVAWLAAMVFLAAFSQTTNLRHGGTPGMSRYALWLIPLAVPLLRRIGGIGLAAWTPALWAVAVVSAMVSSVAFHPGRAQYANQPTLLAEYLWTRHPMWNDPLAEVFQKANLAAAWWLPVATPGCEKILLLGTGAGDGAWPIPCYPARVIESCQAPNSLCYANRVDGKYRFIFPPGPRNGGYHLRRGDIWPASGEAAVRELFNEWRWREMSLARKPPAIVREVINVGRFWSWVGPDRYLFVVQRPAGGASVTFRLPREMEGRLIDVATGTTIQTLRSDKTPFARLSVALPPGSDPLIVAFR